MYSRLDIAGDSAVWYGDPVRGVQVMRVGNRVRDVRLAADLTQSALAKMVGVTRQTVISLEQVGYTPSIKLALQLAEALQTPVAELFWLEPEPGRSR